MTRLHRRAYNLTVEAINSGKPNKTELRREIRERVRSESEASGILFVSTVCDEAVCCAFDTFYKLCKKWKKGEKASMQFRSRRDSRQGFVVQRCAEGGSILPNTLGPVHITEGTLDDVKGQTVRVTWENGRWSVAFRKKLSLSDNQAGGRPAAIDPGVRTFATVYGGDDVVKYGADFQDELVQLHDRLDGLQSVQRKLLNVEGRHQWVADRMRNLRNRIWKTSNRVSDLVDDLHRRVAFDLVKKHDVILLPTFATSQMSARKRRKIGRGTTRRMLTMSHFQFALHLSWMCKKYGKELIRANEAYTSKTDSRTGIIKHNLGGAKSINGFDRDTNGARGILLRALSRVACTQNTSQSELSL